MRSSVRQMVVMLTAVATIQGMALAQQGLGLKYLIRRHFKDEKKLTYAMSIQGSGSWSPKKDGMSSGDSSTEFQFSLVPKTVRESGACTYDLIGETLKAKAETAKGSAYVYATRSGCSLRLGRLKTTDNKANPLLHDMSITFGPRNMLLYGTGLQHIVLFFGVHVDPRFWGVLTMAPQDPVGVGDEWSTDFKVQVPDTKGLPLDVKAQAKVTGWDTYKGRRCLVGRMTAELELKDTWVTLKNGDRIRVDKGKYTAEGKVLWDVQKGLICYATAQNTLTVRADKPDRKSLTYKVSCTLRLLADK